MEAGQALPPNSMTLRLAKASEVPADQPPTQAFYLKRDKNEEDVSLGWVDYFEHLPAAERVSECLRHMTANFKPSATSKVLAINVDTARTLLSSEPGLEDVRFIYTPVIDQPNEPDNPCHASVLGMAPLGEALYQSAAQK